MPWNFVCDPWVLCFHQTQGSQNKFHDIKYINLLYIYLLLLYNSSVQDIEHSPYYIILGSLQTHKMI